MTKRRDGVLQPENLTWDPGGDNHVRIQVPDHQYSLLYTAAISNVTIEDDNCLSGIEEESRTELDTHANMPVVGRHACIISDTGKTADVNAFTPDYKSMTIPIVDAAVQYDCPYDGKTYVLVIRDALHVPSMKTNLLPPFVLREAGVEVNDVPKIQVDDPTVEHHSIFFPETDF